MQTTISEGNTSGFRSVSGDHVATMGELQTAIGEVRKALASAAVAAASPDAPESQAGPNNFALLHAKLSTIAAVGDSIAGSRGAGIRAAVEAIQRDLDRLSLDMKTQRADYATKASEVHGILERIQRGLAALAASLGRRPNLEPRHQAALQHSIRAFSSVQGIIVTGTSKVDELEAALGELGGSLQNLRVAVATATQGDTKDIATVQVRTRSYRSWVTADNLDVFQDLGKELTLLRSAIASSQASASAANRAQQTSAGRIESAISELRTSITTAVAREKDTIAALTAQVRPPSVPLLTIFILF